MKYILRPKGVESYGQFSVVARDAREAFSIGKELVDRGCAVEISSFPGQTSHDLAELERLALAEETGALS